MRTDRFANLDTGRCAPILLILVVVVIIIIIILAQRYLIDRHRRARITAWLKVTILLLRKDQSVLNLEYWGLGLRI